MRHGRDSKLGGMRAHVYRHVNVHRHTEGENTGESVWGTGVRAWESGMLLHAYTSCRSHATWEDGGGSVGNGWQCMNIRDVFAHVRTRPVPTCVSARRRFKGDTGNVIVTRNAQTGDRHNWPDSIRLHKCGIRDGRRSIKERGGNATQGIRDGTNKNDKNHE